MTQSSSRGSSRPSPYKVGPAATGAASDKIDSVTGRYLPVLYEEEAPHWEAARRHELVLQKCRACGKFWYPISACCPFCRSVDFTWAELSGRGTISSYVVYHKAWAPWLEPRAPYAVVQVQLDEGPRLTTNLLGIPPSDIRIGMPVVAIWEDVNERVSLVQFRPAQP